MSNSKILDKLHQLEAFADLIKSNVIALKQELEDGGASKSSARKGSLPASEKARILAKRQKSRIKKATSNQLAAFKSNL